MHARVCERVHLVYNQRGYVIYLLFPVFPSHFLLSAYILREDVLLDGSFVFCTRMISPAPASSTEQVFFLSDESANVLPRVL